MTHKDTRVSHRNIVPFANYGGKPGGGAQLANVPLNTGFLRALGVPGKIRAQACTPDTLTHDPLSGGIRISLPSRNILQREAKGRQGKGAGREKLGDTRANPTEKGRGGLWPMGLQRQLASLHFFDYKSSTRFVK